MTKPTLAEFMESPANNAWVRSASGLNLYIRRTKHCVRDKLLTSLDISNINNPRRSWNIETVKKPRSTGKFKLTCKEVEDFALQYDIEGVYVESVMNYFLPEVLLRYGYEKVDEGPPPSFWKSIARE